EDGIRDGHVTGVQTCALPIWPTLNISVARKATNLSQIFRLTPFAGLKGRAYRSNSLRGALFVPLLHQFKRLGQHGTRAGAVRFEIGRASCRERGWLWVGWRGG